MCKSTEIVASIDDLLTQILLRLPIKSLISFKSVSKHWLSLIADPKFSHLRNPVPNPAIGLFFDIQGHHRYDYIPLSPPHKPCNAPPLKLNGCSILQSCNGLLLGCSFWEADCALYVYNPTTNRVASLPAYNNIGLPRGRTLAFDPVKSHHYKVVIVQAIETAGGCTFQIQIYSSETGVWSVACEMERGGGVQFENGVYWNGSIHWISKRTTDSSLRFHVDSNVLEVMPTPPVQRALYWTDSYYFGESCDHLHYIELWPQLNVYELKKDYSEWFLKYSFDLSPVLAAYPEVIVDHYYYVFTILSLVRGEKEEDSIIVLRIPGKVVKLNLVDGSFVNLYEFEGEQVEDPSGFLNENVFEYIQSLCCV